MELGAEIYLVLWCGNELPFPQFKPELQMLFPSTLSPLGLILRQKQLFAIEFQDFPFLVEDIYKYNSKSIPKEVL